jgi:transposase
MPSALSLVLRTRVLADHQAGASFAELGRKYSVSAEWVRQFIRRHQVTGEVAPRPPINRRVPFHRRHEAELRAAVAANPSLTLEALRTQLGVSCNLSTLWHALRALKISFKKKTLVAAEQVRPEVAARRHDFHVLQSVGLDPDRFVFLDETWVKTNMTRTRGWGPTDRRLIEYVPHGHWMTTTFLCALRSTGLVAPLVIDGAINGELFLAWVRQQLVPTLRPGDIVVMDNLSAHKVAGVADAIREAEASVLCLPPYSPDLNPIENVFAKVKHHMRKRRPRTKSECDTLCGESLDWFSQSECWNYFRHAGYAPNG